MKTVIKIWLPVVTLIFIGSAHAELRRYVDANGMIRFQNIPSTLELQFQNIPSTVEKKIINGKGSQQCQYDHIIRRAGGIYGVSWALIKAVIHAESNFNPKAISPKGAKGLMQIMPENNAILSISDPFNPTQNIFGGTKYFKHMLNRYQNNIHLALAAYNAGPGAVDKYKKIPPYKETQTYVEKVYNLYLYYRQQWVASSFLDQMNSLNKNL